MSTTFADAGKTVIRPFPSCWIHDVRTRETVIS
jgi:hypothetical protein